MSLPLLCSPLQRYAPELALRQQAHLKPTNKSWRVDETYVRVKGEWCYLYRAVDSTGATVEFFFSAWVRIELTGCSRILRTEPEFISSPLGNQLRIRRQQSKRERFSQLLQLLRFHRSKRSKAAVLRHQSPPQSLVSTPLVGDSLLAPKSP